MIAHRRLLLGLLLALAPLAAAAGPGPVPGDLLENGELPALAGGRRALMSSQALANVMVFFRPQQDHSLEALQAMARCEREFSGKPVHWVAVVSARWSPQDVLATVGEAGIQMPVLLDQDDVLYGRLGVRLHPVVTVANQRFQLGAYEPFRKINYCDRIRGKIRWALHEIDQAEVERIDHPPPALFPNELKGAVATRHVHMGQTYLAHRRWEQAAAEARHGLESDPRHGPAHLLLGDALAAQGRCEEASAAWRSAQEADAGLAQQVKTRRGGCVPGR